MAVYPIIMSQGKLMQKEELTFPFEERGLQFGDGIYEVIRIYNGRYYLLEEHIDRLFRSLKAIEITLPYTYQEIVNGLNELLERNKMSNNGIVYLQVSRGSAPRTHFFPENVVPNLYAYIQDFPRNINSLTNGVKTITHEDERWKNCYIKTINLLPNVLAKQKAVEQNCFEAILYNRENIVTEGSSSNIFLVQDGKVYTHPATNRILNGCVRMAVKRFCNDLNLPFVEERFTLFDLPKADELFLTSSTAEVMPIIQVNETVINDGKRGEITRVLQEAYEQDAQIDSESPKTLEA